MSLDLRCPACNKLLARDFEGKVALYCVPCRLDVTVSQRPREERRVVLQFSGERAIKPA